MLVFLKILFLKNSSFLKPLLHDIEHITYISEFCYINVIKILESYMYYVLTSKNITAEQNLVTTNDNTIIVSYLSYSDRKEVSME